MSGQNATNDAVRINCAMTVLLGIPIDRDNPADYVNHPLIKGLTNGGYVDFLDDLVGASEEDLMSLSYAPDSTKPTDLIPVTALVGAGDARQFGLSIHPKHFSRFTNSCGP